MHWDGSYENAIQIVDWMRQPDGQSHGRYCYSTTKQLIEIDTLEGTMYAAQGDYIIRGVKGEYYPCREDIFSVTYERVEE